MNKLLIFLAVLLFIFEQTIAQQPLPFLRVSPGATVTQKIATFATVTVDYHRPAVNGRELWGTLVPYGLATNNFGNRKPMPWRAGANETTVITFSHDVQIEEKPLKAGSYGLHMIPAEEKVTIIFNSNDKSWGSFFYEEDKDVLRVDVNWLEAPHQESLIYFFENLTPNSATAILHWGNRKIPFIISVAQNDVILNAFRSSLTNLQGFNPAAYAAAVNFCINNNVNLIEAEAWIDHALNLINGQNFANRQAKSKLLGLRGEHKEAKEMMDLAIQNATENELNNYGYQLMGQNPSQIEEALEIFKINMDRFPDSWNVYDSYGEALNNKGDKQEALKYYKIALEKAPEGQKKRIEGIIKSLKS